LIGFTRFVGFQSAIGVKVFVWGLRSHLGDRHVPQGRNARGNDRTDDGNRYPRAMFLGQTGLAIGFDTPWILAMLIPFSSRGRAARHEVPISLNRLNVATSRAKCLCILVASPSIFEAQCRTPRQVQLANAFCRYLEMATPL
jgi:hypothetical protein